MERSKDGEPRGPPQRASRIDALTGLRFFPALVVVLSHLNAPKRVAPVLGSFLAAGYAGVTVFFVLSGFVLSHNYHERFSEAFSVSLLRSYFAARLARVYPLYLLMLVWVPWRKLWNADPAQARLWWEHAFALQAWKPDLKDAYAFNSPGWSISVEFFLYACFPILIVLLAPVVRSARRCWVALCVVVLCMAGAAVYFSASGRAELPWEDASSAHRWLFRNPACRLGDFLLGMLSARLVALDGTQPRRGSAWLGAVSAALMLAQMCWPSQLYSAASWDVSYALPAAGLIFALASTPGSLGARLLSTPSLVLLGEASYALYLSHVYMLRQMFERGLPAESWLSTQALTLLMVVAVSVGLHITIERPSRTLLRWLLDPLSRRPQPRSELVPLPRSDAGLKVG